MKGWMKNLLFALCAAPFLVKLPYMLSVWKYSPLERDDIYIWLALPVFIVASEMVRRRAGIRDKIYTKRALLYIAMAVCVLGWMASLALGINAAGVLLGIAIFALGVEFRFGRRVFVSQFPTIFFAVATCPSLSYWLDYYLHIGADEKISYFAMKVLAGVAFFSFWSIRTLIVGHYPRISNMIFCACVFAAVLYAKISMQTLETADPFALDTSLMKSGDWIGIEVPKSDSDERFFTGCPVVERRSYYNTTSNINLLALQVGKISNIHPIGICLESAGFEVRASRQIYMQISPTRKIQVNEVELDLIGEHFAAYSFFSNSNSSTGDFTKFRFSQNKQEMWRHYQIVTPAEPSVEDARERVLVFLRNFDADRDAAARPEPIPAAPKEAETPQN